MKVIPLATVKDRIVKDFDLWGRESKWERRIATQALLDWVVGEESKNPPTQKCRELEIWFEEREKAAAALRSIRFEKQRMVNAGTPANIIDEMVVSEAEACDRLEHAVRMFSQLEMMPEVRETEFFQNLGLPPF